MGRVQAITDVVSDLNPCRIPSGAIEGSGIFSQPHERLAGGLFRWNRYTGND
jgi:hypothetical protein